MVPNLLNFTKRENMHDSRLAWVRTVLLIWLCVTSSALLYMDLFGSDCCETPVDDSWLLRLNVVETYIDKRPSGESLDILLQRLNVVETYISDDPWAGRTDK